jgi:hypothetical protein
MDVDLELGEILLDRCTAVEEYREGACCLYVEMIETMTGKI